MSTDHIDGSENGKAVLRAVDAHTEVQVSESQGPAYADLSDGRGQRKPVIPEHYQSWEQARRHITLASARHGHATAYHGVRLPKYAVLTLAWAVLGILRTGWQLLRWWHVVDMHELEHQAAAAPSSWAGQPCSSGLPTGSVLPPVAADSALKKRYTPTAANRNTA